MPDTNTPETNRADGVERSLLWPFVYWPLIWILLIHIGTRVAWLCDLK